MTAGEASQLTVLVGLLTVLVAYLAALVAGYAWEQGQRMARDAAEVRRAVRGAWHPSLSDPLGTVPVPSSSTTTTDQTQPIPTTGGVSA